MPRKKLYEDQDEDTCAFSIRISGSLKAVIQKRAQEDRRSLNQEMVWLLEKAIELLEEKPGSTDERPSC